MSPLASKSLAAGGGPRRRSRSSRSASAATSLVSDDGGKTWQQSSVPVSSDLTAVFFVDERKGWAVGHDGVILASERWRRARGRCSSTACAPTRRSSTTSRASPDRSDQGAARGSEAQRRAGRRQAVPRRVVRRRERGLRGRCVQPHLPHATTAASTWKPWFDRTDNPKFLNLYAIRPAAGGLFIAGEGGPRAEARRVGAALPRRRAAVPGHAARRRRRRERRARVRPARQRVPQRRRGQDVDARSTRGCRRPSSPALGLPMAASRSPT